MLRRLVAATTATLVVSGLVAGLTAGPAQAHPRPWTPRPVIFVHGGSGSAAQAGDVLRIDGTSVLNTSTSPRTKRAIALFAYDAGSDGVSHPAAGVPQFARLPFISGLDLSVRGADPPDGVVRPVPRSAVVRGGPTS